MIYLGGIGKLPLLRCTVRATRQKGGFVPQEGNAGQAESFHRVPSRQQAASSKQQTASRLGRCSERTSPKKRKVVAPRKDYCRPWADRLEGAVIPTKPNKTKPSQNEAEHKPTNRTTPIQARPKPNQIKPNLAHIRNHMKHTAEESPH